jgi:hypothetical protein
MLREAGERAAAAFVARMEEAGVRALRAALGPDSRPASWSQVIGRIKVLGRYIRSGLITRTAEQGDTAD